MLNVKITVVNGVVTDDSNISKKLAADCVPGWRGK